jgi:hypothetical protein
MTVEKKALRELGFGSEVDSGSLDSGPKWTQEAGFACFGTAKNKLILNTCVLQGGRRNRGGL